MKYQTITIDNFRGISKLEITDLQRINLLVGRNNCGKTSVLEAALLLAGMASPQLSVLIHNSRNLPLGSDEHFGFMFKNLDFSIPIQLKGSFDSDERKLTVTPLYGLYQKRNGDNAIMGPSATLSATSNMRIVEGINFDYVLKNGKQYHGECHVKEKQVTTKPPFGYIENLNCLYFNPYSQTIVNDKQLEDYLVHKDLDSLISILQEIEPRVHDIRMGAESRVFVDMGLGGKKALFPINIMGDGMRKIFTLLVTIAETQDGIVLIDELENGLHYSSVSLAWKAIITTCIKYNVQIIATTHSYECVKSFSNTYDTLDHEGDDIRLFRIDRDGEKHETFTYDPKVLRAGIEKGWEVR
jgi:hypothetical protein